MDNKSNEWHTSTHRVKVAAGGRIVIPSELRQELGVTEGDELLLIRGESGVRMVTQAQVVKEAQAYFRKLKKPGQSVVDELLSERRAEAAKEDLEFKKK